MSDASLADALVSLSSPTRIALLRALRSPRVLAEIEVRSGEREEGPNIARQSVSKHLDKLVEAGFVSTRDVVREGRDTVEFVVNHQAIFLLAEEVRALARLRPALEPEGETAGRPLSDLALGKGPCLVVAKGLEEGTTFPLRPEADRRAWLVGRRRDAEVPLDFDPSISSRHSLVTWDGRAHVVEDLGSRNGTLVNFRSLAVGERRALRHGDLVGVGRCLLVYWA